MSVSCVLGWFLKIKPSSLKQWSCTLVEGNESVMQLLSFLLLVSGDYVRRYTKIADGASKQKKTKGNGYYEITKYNGPHTCESADVRSDFLAAEIKGLLKARPSLSVSELSKWVKEEFGYTVARAVMWALKRKSSDKSFSVLPKFMASLCSSNKIRLEWRYHPLPDPKDASFRSVFWAFQQSVEGFPYYRPVVIVDVVDGGKNCGKLLVAAGFDAENQLFPLAFAVVSQEKLSPDSWRWFFACIRKKATRREGLCLITTMDPDIVTVVNEPECHQWVEHRFCLRHFCFEFYRAFRNNLMTGFVYKAGSTGSVSSFDDYLEKIEEMNPEARKWLDKTPPHKWALSLDDGGMRFGVMETNLIFATYGFINYLPITICVLLIFDHLAEHFISQRGLLRESLNSGDKYAKHVMTKLGEYKGTYDVLPLDNTRERFQVADGNNKRFVVHRTDRVCTCGVWQLY